MQPSFLRHSSSLAATLVGSVKASLQMVSHRIPTRHRAGDSVDRSTALGSRP